MTAWVTPFVGGIYSLAVAVHLMGPVVQVSAYANTSHANTPEGLVYDSDMGIACRFACRAIGSMHCTGRSSQPQHGIRHFRVFGTRGRLDFDVFAGRLELPADGLRTVYEDFTPTSKQSAVS